MGLRRRWSSWKTSEKIESAIIAYLEQGNRADAVVCPSSNSSLAAIAAVEHAGLVIGDTVDVFAKEVTPILKRVRSEVLTVSEDVAAAGAFMARAAIQRIKDPDGPPLQKVDVPKGMD